MKKYDIDLNVTFTVRIQVEADGIDEAEDTAMDNFYAGNYNSAILKEIMDDPELDSATVKATYVANNDCIANGDYIYEPKKHDVYFHCGREEKCVCIGDCEKNCPRYYSCQSIADANDALKTFEDEE